MSAKRVTDNNQPLYFPAIDGLRFIAFLFVFISHFHGTIISNFFSNIGWCGVELFFLLSGFLLTRLLFAEYTQTNTIKISKYFVRRILRIWPLYFAYLLVTILLSLFWTNSPVSIARLFGNIFFYDNILTAFSGFNNNLATIHLWSISLEEQYYLLLPFLIPWLIKQPAKKAIRIIILALLFLLLVRYFLVYLHPQYTFVYVLPFSADSFLAGILLGLGVIDAWAKKINAELAFLLGTGFLLLLRLFPHASVTDSNILLCLVYLTPAIAFSFIFISLVHNTRGWLYWIFTNTAIRYLGKISFGLYIFHVLANRITNHIYLSFGIPIDIWGFLLSLSITILLSVLSYELFEKHFLKMKSKYTVIKNREV